LELEDAALLRFRYHGSIIPAEERTWNVPPV